MKVKSKNKNKAIQGRRNRCHAQPMIAVLKARHLDEDEAKKMARDLRDAMDGSYGRSMVLTVHDPEIDIQFIRPNCKRPRFV